MRLLPGEALQAVQADLMEALADALLQAPPYELRWMRQFDGADHPHKVGSGRGAE